MSGPFAGFPDPGGSTGSFLQRLPQLFPQLFPQLLPQLGVSRARGPVGEQCLEVTGSPQTSPSTWAITTWLRSAGALGAAHFADGEAETQKAELASAPKSLSQWGLCCPRCVHVCARVYTPRALLSAVCASGRLGWDEPPPPRGGP